MGTLKNSNFSSRLKDLRWKLKLTQDEMAVRLQCSGNYVWMLEKGNKEPSAKIVARVEELERELESASNPTSDIHGAAAQATVLYLQERLSELNRAAHEPAGKAADVLERACLEYFTALLAKCRGSVARMGWLLVELQTKFPLHAIESAAPAETPAPPSGSGSSSGPARSGRPAAGDDASREESGAPGARQKPPTGAPSGGKQ